MATPSTIAEATAPTGDIKIFVDAFNLYLDSEIKGLTDAQNNLKNIYDAAIKISTPRTGTWPKDASVVTIGDLFKYTFPDITTNTFIEPPKSTSSNGFNVTIDDAKLEDSKSWKKDFESTPEIKEMFVNIKRGLNSNAKLADFNQLKKPGVTNPSLYTPGQYYFDVFMFYMLSDNGPLKRPNTSNGGDGLGSEFLKTYGGSASVSNFDPSGEIELSKHNSPFTSYPIVFDYFEFAEIVNHGDSGVGVKYKMIKATSVDLEYEPYRTKPDNEKLSVLMTQYRSGVLSELETDTKFNKYRGEKVENTTDFIGYCEHILLYKAFVQAGDNYKSVVLPYKEPEPITPVITQSPEPTTAVTPAPLESEYVFNVEKIDTFIFVSGTPSIPIELTIIPNDGTTYIFEEPVYDNIGDDDLSDEYQETGYKGEEELLGEYRAESAEPVVIKMPEESINGGDNGEPGAAEKNITVAQAILAVMNTLISEGGFTVEEAAGICGNIYAESSFIFWNVENGASNIRPSGMGSDRWDKDKAKGSNYNGKNFSGTGLAQWTFGRRYKYEKYVGEWLTKKGVTAKTLKNGFFDTDPSLHGSDFNQVYNGAGDKLEAYLKTVPYLFEASCSYLAHEFGNSYSGIQKAMRGGSVGGNAGTLIKNGFFVNKSGSGIAKTVSGFAELVVCNFEVPGPVGSAINGNKKDKYHELVAERSKLAKDCLATYNNSKSV